MSCRFDAVVSVMADPWSALPWESRARGGWASDDDDDDDKDYYEDVSKEDADAHFAKYLVFLKSAGHLTAKQACILAFWAMKGGTKGLVETVAVKQRGDHFSRTFDTAVRPEREEGGGVIDRYDILAPSYRRADDALSVSDWIPMQLPLDCARADVEADEHLPTKLTDATSSVFCQGATSSTPSPARPQLGSLYILIIYILTEFRLRGTTDS